MRKSSKILLTLLVGITGCQSTHRSATTRRISASTQPVLAPSALLTLDQIPPATTMPATPPEPASQPSVQTLLLFAQAHDDLLQNHNYAAIGLLERAVILDPHSFELYYELGRAYLTTNNSADRAVDAFEKAAALRPTDLSVHLQLARLYLLRGEPDSAIHHLRLARLTDDYQDQEDSAASTDLLLARALQQKAYDRAASDEYAKVLDDLKHPTNVMRANVELGFLILHPEVIEEQLGELAEVMGQNEAALKHYENAAAVDRDNFDAQAHVVRILLKMGKDNEAAELAARLVRQYQASLESMDLLREVYRQIGSENGVIDQLAKLHADEPGDRTILFTLADTLKGEGRQAEAEHVLAEAAKQDNYSPDLVQRLFQMQMSRGDTMGGARLLVEALAARPDSLRQLVSMWEQLLEPTRKDRLRLSTLQALEVAPSAQSAKDFWISTMAELWSREELAHDSLAAATKGDKPFAPAYRLLLEQTWGRGDWSTSQKKKFSEDLAQRAADEGDEALAAELRGISLLAEKNPADAEKAFDQARKLGGNSPDLTISYASALLAEGKNAQAEQALWKLVTDYPTCDDGYATLYGYYRTQNQEAQAVRVLRTWLDNAPMSTDAKLCQAIVFFQAQRFDLGTQALNSLIDAHPDDPQLLRKAAEIFQQTNQISEYIEKLEAIRTAHPQNQAVVEELVELYTQRNEKAEAERTLNATHAAVGNDPDLLYYLAHLYSMIGDQQQAEDVLQEVLKLDPNHSGAANDLGYSWADEGKNLDRAETLIRLAVKDEPDNESFLDSLGWVQYKRGEFGSALKSLQQAVADNPEPDPVVLNHLGDTYYRLGKKEEAQKTWERAMVRLAEVNEERDDLKDLRASLPDKLKAVESGGKIDVAPTAK